MNENRLNELLERCESPIERELLTQLYPCLTVSHARKLCAQYMIDTYDDIPVTIPDFAFPDMQIAIYCDGFAAAEGNREKFARDRFQLRELQLRGWVVLRFAGREIKRNSEMVVETIQRAIEKMNRRQEFLRQEVSGVIVDSHVPDNRRPPRLTEGVSEVSESVEDSAESFYNRGLNLVGFGGNVRYDRAIAHFTKAIELNPDFASAFHSRAYAYYSIDDYPRSIADYTQAIELNPDFASAFHSRANAYYEMADYPRAITDYTQAIQLNPGSPYSYFGRGAAYGKLGDRKLADDDYAMAALLEDGSVEDLAESFYNCGLNLARSSGNVRYDRAIAHFTKAIELNPDFASAFHSRAYAYYSIDDYPRSIADYTQAIELNPDFASAFHSRANAYYEMADYPRAITDYTQAIQLNPGSPYSYFGRGAAYGKLGDRKLADDDYAMAALLEDEQRNH